jgi:hypothetical protein
MDDLLRNLTDAELEQLVTELRSHDRRRQEAAVEKAAQRYVDRGEQ